MGHNLGLINPQSYNEVNRQNGMTNRYEMGNGISNPLGNTENRNQEQFRGQNNIDNQLFKKQMEFKGGKLHQLITD